ncbi:hypothetical protein Vadar_034799 [Vaccinium darrowii]|uniref:Uncharacterized protein n=1 Tax=Vaccinium darrowii TaxID=229202 RepID=A0ACB7YIF8_9ERIC|nr:hypothetical protein Vadar_034799 [Vaccinium darrowii]
MARLRLSLAVFSSCLVLFASGVFSQSTFTFINQCSYPVWPGLLTGGGPSLPTTGFLLDSSDPTTVSIPASWSGNLWGRTLCSTDANGQFTCATGDCGSGTIECCGNGPASPITLFEITLDGPNGYDSYDVSLVNGFNVPMNVVTQGGNGNCGTVGCPTDINAECPAELQVIGNGGGVVGCMSACEAFGGPTYCCNGPGKCSTCGPTSYSEFFKSACPLAYSYACDGGPTSCDSPTYTITFCP